MIKSTIGDLLDGNLDAGDCRLYVVRDGTAVFYVGRSRDIVPRLLAHVGLDRPDTQGRACFPSSLGRLIESNLPASRSWQIDLYTVEDCVVLIEKHFPIYKRWGTDTAEQALINELHPCLNVVHNDAPSPLPERYVRVDREAEEAKRRAAQKLHVPYYKANAV